MCWLRCMKSLVIMLNPGTKSCLDIEPTHLLNLGCRIGTDPFFCVLYFFSGQCVNNHQSPLSGEDIWIEVLTQKRSIVHINGCDIWIDLRPILKYLAQPFSSKLRSKEAKGLRSGNLGK